MFENYRNERKSRKKREARIAELATWLDQIEVEELEKAKTPKERFEAQQSIHAMTKFEANDYQWLLQFELLDKVRRSPIIVPFEYWDSIDRDDMRQGMRRTLTWQGEKWVKNELKKLQRAEIEFWFKLVMPVVSFILSVTALIMSIHKH